MVQTMPHDEKRLFVQQDLYPEQIKSILIESNTMKRQLSKVNQIMGKATRNDI